MRALRRRDEEQGFTLIELMVVVLIIGILIAIALPTYLGARKRAADRAAQTELRSGLVAGSTYFAIGSTYTGLDTTTAAAAEPSVQWIGAGAPGLGQVAIQVASGPDLLLINLSSSGTYFCVAQVANNPLTYKGHDPAFANVDTIAECNQGW